MTLIGTAADSKDESCPENRPCLPRLFTNPVAAGFPSPADDYTDKPLDLDEYLVRHPASTFFVKVSGQSMKDAGILDGDVLVVDRATSPGNRRIVVAVIDGEFTVKRLVISSDGAVSLVAENEDFEPIVPVASETGELEIWGTVVGLVRRY